MTIYDYTTMYEKRMDFLKGEAIKRHKKDFDELCEIEADEEFEETATPEEVVGYYLYHYGDGALTMWLDNMSYAKERTYNDIRVTVILTELSTKSVRERMVKDVFSGQD